MVKSFFSLTCGIMFPILINAQNNLSGIYRTQLDFENRKLSYSTDAKNEKNKIRFNEFLDKPFITIKHNGEKIILFKDEIFAYQKQGGIVRTHDFVSYNFIERGVIWIYFKDITVLQGKGIKRERKYFYSVSGKDKIIPLTIYNLKRSFPGKYVFHNLLDAQFRSDFELKSYNSLEKKFQVNHLLETTGFGTGNTIP
jgi:hypothetical protein